MTYTPHSPVLAEGWMAGAFLVSEAENRRSRDGVVYSNLVASQVTLQAGLVVTNISLGTAAVAAGANTGNGTLGSLLLGGALIDGQYVATFTSATAFTVVRPDGAQIGAGVVGTTFSNVEISFKITAGGTAFVAGDSFTILANPGDVGVTSWTGAGVPYAVLFNSQIVQASATANVTVISREAEVNLAELQWDAAVLSAGNVAALQNIAVDALRANGVIAR